MQLRKPTVDSYARVPFAKNIPSSSVHVRSWNSITYSAKTKWKCKHFGKGPVSILRVSIPQVALLSHRVHQNSMSSDPSAFPALLKRLAPCPTEKTYSVYDPCLWSYRSSLNIYPLGYGEYYHIRGVYSKHDSPGQQQVYGECSGGPSKNSPISSPAVGRFRLCFIACHGSGLNFPSRFSFLVRPKQLTVRAGQSPELTAVKIAKYHFMSTHALAVLTQLGIDHIRSEKCEEDGVAFLTSVSSFTDLSDPWTCESSQEAALQLLESFFDISDLKGRSNALSSVLEQKIKPAFSNTRNPAITQQARKAIDPLPIDSSASGELGSASRPWRYPYRYIVTVLGWIIGSLCQVEVGLRHDSPNFFPS